VVLAFEPRAISGPTSCLLELGEFMHGFPLESAITFGEVLTPEDRQELKQYFGAKVLDLYSASETGHISWECPSGSGYHMNADAVVVEVLDDADRPVPGGEMGHLVLTTLWNPTMPVIRYRIADLGRLLPHPCACGITLPLMAQVEGRVVDRLLSHDGRRVSPMRFALMNVGPYHAAIRRWRLIQRAVDDLLVEVVWAAEPIPGLDRKMSEAYSRPLAGPVHVEIRAVEGFPAERGRKFRPVESLVR
jgi:phenylacetate-CoA ligase